MLASAQWGLPYGAIWHFRKKVICFLFTFQFWQMRYQNTSNDRLQVSYNSILKIDDISLSPGGEKVTPESPKNCLFQLNLNKIKSTTKYYLFLKISKNYFFISLYSCQICYCADYRTFKYFKRSENIINWVL